MLVKGAPLDIHVILQFIAYMGLQARTGRIFKTIIIEGTYEMALNCAIETIDIYQKYWFHSLPPWVNKTAIFLSMRILLVRK